MIQKTFSLEDIPVKVVGTRELSIEARLREKCEEALDTCLAYASKRNRHALERLMKIAEKLGLNPNR